MSRIRHYTQQLKALLTTGAAWLSEPGSVLDETLESLAVEFAAIEQRAFELIEETDPRTTVQLLNEWERAFALPEPCLSPPTTIAGRQKALHEKVTRIGGQSRQYYIGVAKRANFDISIQELRPFTVDSSVDDALWEEDIVFTWIVVAPLETITEFTVNSGCDEPLRTWGNELLECLMTRLKPAHTTVLFSYV